MQRSARSCAPVSATLTYSASTRPFKIILRIRQSYKTLRKILFLNTHFDRRTNTFVLIWNFFSTNCQKDRSVILVKTVKFTFINLSMRNTEIECVISSKETEKGIHRVEIDKIKSKLIGVRLNSSRRPCIIMLNVYSVGGFL